jgi:hypothetical protein
MKIAGPWKIYKRTQFHGPTLTDLSFASNSQVWTSAIFLMVEATGLRSMAYRPPSMAWSLYLMS